MLSDEQLREIEQRCAAAERGNWETDISADVPVLLAHIRETERENAELWAYTELWERVEQQRVAAIQSMTWNLNGAWRRWR